MKKGSACAIAAWYLVAMMVIMLVADQVHEAAAVDCNVMQLRTCLPAITGPQDPSADCCSKLKEQEPCFCGYLSNPALRPYVDSPNAKKMAAICGVPTPKC